VVWLGGWLWEVRSGDRGAGVAVAGGRGEVLAMNI